MVPILEKTRIWKEKKYIPKKNAPFFMLSYSQMMLNVKRILFEIGILQNELAYYNILCVI